MTEPSDDDDRALLNRFTLDGDSEALGALAARHERNLLGLASGVLGGRRALASEAVQNAWVKVIRYGRSFRGTSSVKTWLYRIVINQCRDLRRREGGRVDRGGGSTPDAIRRTGKRTQTGTGAASGALQGSAQASLDPAQDREQQDREQHARLADAVADLPDVQREIVLLCYHRDLTHTQVADILNIPRGTLKSRLHAALSTLRGTLAVEHTS